MIPFTLYEPESLDEALDILRVYEAPILAGGTALVLLWRQRLFRPERVVWLGRCPGLDQVRQEPDGTLRLGALLRHAAIAAHPLVRAQAPLLAEAENEVGDPQIRHMGTLGGNLCHADPQSDPPAALLALGARVRLQQRGGERLLPLEAFFTTYYQTALQPSELLTEVVVPPQPTGLRTLYTRFLAGPADDRPLVTVAVAAQVEDRMCGEVRIAVGAASAVPFRARMAEERLRGQELSATLCVEAAGLTARELDPLDDLRASAGYRLHVTEVVVRRALLRALVLEEGR